MNRDPAERQFNTSSDRRGGIHCASSVTIIAAAIEDPGLQDEGFR